jgi:hypothetical protein
LVIKKGATSIPAALTPSLFIHDEFIEIAKSLTVAGNIREGELAVNACSATGSGTG